MIINESLVNSLTTLLLFEADVSYHEDTRESAKKVIEVSTKGSNPVVTIQPNKQKVYSQCPYVMNDSFGGFGLNNKVSLLEIDDYIVSLSDTDHEGELALNIVKCTDGKHENVIDTADAYQVLMQYNPYILKLVFEVVK